MTQQAIPATPFAPWSVAQALIGKVADGIATLIARGQEERTRQAVLAELHQFPDYMLSDIGVLRSELPDQAPRLLDFHPQLIASGVAQRSSILPQNMTSR